MSAQTKRTEALAMLGALYFPERGGYAYQPPAGGPAEVAENIAKLAALGRTERWQKAITRWAGMVAEQAATNGDVAWALLQGSIYAGHAA